MKYGYSDDRHVISGQLYETDMCLWFYENLIIIIEMPVPNVIERKGLCVIWLREYFERKLHM